jgi:hypothetical protein
MKDALITLAVAILSFFLRREISRMNDHHDYASFKPFDRWKSDEQKA